MKAYFEKVYLNNNTLYWMTVQEAFKDSSGNMTKETYYIYSAKSIRSGEVTDWVCIKTYVNKKKAVRYFQYLITKSNDTMSEKKTPTTVHVLIADREDDDEQVTYGTVLGKYASLEDAHNALNVCLENEIENLKTPDYMGTFYSNFEIYESEV